MLLEVDQNFSDSATENLVIIMGFLLFKEKWFAVYEGWGMT